ncbi:MAG: CvpA family protein [Bacteroidales bacterium]|nr:CvpA family protein [Bacteroidales bacterium]
MNALDIVIVLILVIGAVAGLRKGFIAQLFAIISILLSAWLAYTFSSAFSEWLAAYIHAEGFWLNIISFLLIFIGVGLLCRLLGNALEGIFKLALLGWLNRLLGAVFSAAKYALVIGLAIILFNSLNSRFGWVPEEKLAESKMYVIMKNGAYSVFPYFQGLLSGKDKLI